MLFASLVISFCSAELIQLLSLGSESNPTKGGLSFSFDNEWFNSDQQDYTVEFWIRPRTGQSGLVRLMEDEDDWKVEWSPSSFELFLNSKNSEVTYCTLPNVYVVWTHIAFSKSTASLLFQCYKNSVAVESFGSSAVSTYPDIVQVGLEFAGNLRELRFWLGVERSALELGYFYKKFFQTPFPEELSLYWPMINPSDPNEISEEVDGYAVEIPDQWNTTELWVGEDAETLLCAVSQFLENGSCRSCHPYCYLCNDEALSDCKLTTARYLDTSDTQGNSYDWVPVNSEAKTIEFWMMLNEWTAPSQPIIHFEPLLKIQRKSSTENVVFMNSANEEKLSVLIEMSKWYHIAFVSENLDALIYINGIENLNELWSSNSESLTRIYLGTAALTDSTFPGILRELRMWSTTRSEASIKETLYVEYQVPFPIDLTEYWKLNEGESITISESISGIFVTSTSLRDLWRALNCLVEECLVLCGPGKFLTDASECVECDVSCSECSGPLPEDCTICKPEYPYQTPEQSNCYAECPEEYKLSLLSLSCVVECEPSTFEANNECLLCSDSCLTCNGPDSDSCLSCREGFNLDEGLCKEDCAAGEFLIGVECFPCNSNCKGCDGATSADCTLCFEDKFLFNGTCLEDCPTKTYNSEGICYDCDVTCAECSGPLETNCLVCDEQHPYREMTGECVSECNDFLLESTRTCVAECPEKTYQQNATCKACDASCLECSGPSSTQCTSCLSNLYNGTCLEQCPPKTFQENGICYDCFETCASCSSSLSTECTECSDQFQYRVEDTKECVSQCPEEYFSYENSCVFACPNGFFVSNAVCEECSVNCRECVDLPEKCTACTSPLLLNDTTCEDACPTHYFGLDGVCTECEASCLECNGPTNTDCLSCSSELKLDFSARICTDSCPETSVEVNNICYADCPAGYFATSSNQCIQCPTECFNCISATNCSSCIDPFLLLEQTCIQSCPQAYFAADGECRQCFDLCSECTGSSSNECTGCNEGIYLYEGTCLEICPAGTFSAGLVCDVCEIVDCLACSSNEVCIECASGNFISSSDPSLCTPTCEPGEIQYLSTTKCISYISRFPTNTIELEELTRFSIDYPTQIQRGTGALSIYRKSGEFIRSVANAIVFEKTVSISVVASDFEYGSDYYITFPDGFLRTSDNSIVQGFPPVTWEFSVSEYVFKPLQAIVNAGVLGQEIQRNTDFTLDASASYDPSALQFIGSIEYSWTCYDFSANYIQFKSSGGEFWADYITGVNPASSTAQCANWDYSDPPSDLELQVSNSYGLDTVLRYVFSMTDNNGRTSTDDIYIRISSEANIPLLYADAPMYSISPTKPFLLQSIESYFPKRSDLEWKIVPNQVQILTPLTDSPFLAIAEGSLEPGSTYLINLYYSELSAKSSIALQIKVNKPPVAGALYLDREFGIALTDQIQGQLLSCSDEDLPLSYTFTYALGDYSVPEYSQVIEGVSVAEYHLTSPQPSSSFAMYLPSGLITVIGYCTDGLGATSHAIGYITLSNAIDLVAIKEASELISYEIYDEQAVKELALATSVAIHLNQTSQIGDTADEIKSRLLSVVEDSIEASNALINEDPKLSSFLYFASLEALEAMSLSPLSSFNLEKLLTILAGADIVRLKGKDILRVSDANLSVESSQYIFNSKDLYNLASKLYVVILNICAVPDIIKFPDMFLDSLGVVNQVLGLTSQFTEQSRTLDLMSGIVYTQKSFLNDLENTVFELDSAHQVQFRNISQDDFQASVHISSLGVQPFNSSSVTVSEILHIEIVNEVTNSVLQVDNLEEPIFLSFEIKREQLETARQKLNDEGNRAAGIRPVCVYWNVNEWSYEGCNLKNIDEVSSIFENSADFPPTVNLVCACKHLSTFTVAFELDSSSIQSSGIVRSGSKHDYSFTQWETSLVFWILAGHIIVFFTILLASHYWDKQHPGLKNPSFPSEKNYRFCDPGKVDAVLQQLQKDQLRRAIAKGKRSSSNDPIAHISKVANSALLKKLMEFKKKMKTSDEKVFSAPDHPVEAFINSHSSHGVLGNIQTFLERRQDDPRYFPSFLDVSTPRRTLETDRKDLENTVSQLKLHLHNMETHTYMASAVDQFLDRYDSSNKFPDFFKQRLARQSRTFKPSDLKSLGYSLSEFEALKCGKDQEVFPDTKKLTGGLYCKYYLAEKIIEEVKKFQSTLQLSYWSLVGLFLKKEHKLFSLFLNLHIEFTKKQVVSFLFLGCIVQLLLCQVYVLRFNWQFGETYNNANICVWGCNHEAQVLAGVVCANASWLFSWISKYCFARNMIDYSSSTAWK